ncbi:hypothetical protein [Streptomyces xantholiticus]|uniref:hypothetical protein n=1 Tax=Streptomyces xantholiticus TaxID=68285 RepID=UPI001E2C0C33|nr:hypothetical protein [Streptomyces xantholiticus]
MPFEDDLGAAMRRTGETFGPSDRPGLVDGGLIRGRRRLARRRAVAVTGSVLALTVVGVTGGYTTGALGSDGGRSSAAASAGPTAPASDSASAPAEAGGVTLKEMIETFKGLLPEGRTIREDGSGITKDPEGGLHGPYVHLVFDDGRGAAAMGLGVSVVDPTGQGAADSVTCPSQALMPHDACQEETLSDGSRYMLFQGYEYPDRREDTKVWRATLVTPKGVKVDASEWNARAEKGAQVSRPTPPLMATQMKALVTNEVWRTIGAQLGKPREETPPPGRPDGAAVNKVLASLLPGNLEIVDQQGDPGYGFVVADDGRGASFIQVNAQTGMADLAQDVFAGDVTTLPDGTKVMVKKENDPDQKGGAGVVGWTVDTLRPDGFRVVMTAFNAPGQGKDASRAEPVLSIEQMRTVVLDEKWRTAAG